MKIEEFTKLLKELREVFEQENMIKENKKQLRKEIDELKLKCEELDCLEWCLNFEKVYRRIFETDTSFNDDMMK